jgi:TolB protein
VVVGALGLAACGNSSPNQGASSGATTSIATTTTTSTIPLASGHEASRQAIPWKQVGSGWALALWDSSAPPQPEEAPTTVPGETAGLYLLNPEGGRYLVTSFPAGNIPNLVAWSGDGRRALLTDQSGSSDNSSTQVTQIDLASGAVHRTSIPSSVTVTYSNPSGLALLATDQINPSLQRLSSDGAVELSYPTQFGALGAFNGSSRESPDGTQIAMGTHGGGIALVDNAGQVTSNLVIAGTSYCSPVRWWAASEVLASCVEGSTGISTLWLVPTSGAVPTALTVTPPAGSQDNGDEDAWQAGGGTYLQDAGACGYQYLAVLDPDHTTSPVTVPGVGDNVSQLILGAVGNQLLVHSANSCGAGISLLWYDPGSNVANVVLGPGANGGNVIAAILFGDDN